MDDALEQIQDAGIDNRAPRLMPDDSRARLACRSRVVLIRMRPFLCAHLQTQLHFSAALFLSRARAQRLGALDLSTLR